MSEQDGERQAAEAVLRARLERAQGALLPHPSAERILACYKDAPGSEISSGKFLSPESSAALVANAFGLFLDRPDALSPMPGTPMVSWPASSVCLEATVRFPWSGGRHPCLDVLIETSDALIGVESKRYEPFRPKSKPDLSEAYWRNAWGPAMLRFEAMRDRLRDEHVFKHLDACQLIKHAFALRTAVHRNGDSNAKRPVLFYLHAEPVAWPDARPVREDSLQIHRREIEQFSQSVSGDEVLFVSATYREILDRWIGSEREDMRRHASAISQHFFSHREVAG